MVAAIGAVILFAKTRSWPTILIFLGSVGYVINYAALVFFDVAFHRHWILGDSPVWKMGTLMSAINGVFGVGTLFIAVGLLMHGLRTKAPHLTKR